MFPGGVEATDCSLSLLENGGSSFHPFHSLPPLIILVSCLDFPKKPAFNSSSS